MCVCVFFFFFFFLVVVFSPAWSIHRLACQEPECGFHCKKNIGCFTYNTTDFKEFKITIFCYDAYDSDVTDIFTLKLDYNRAPAFTNLPSELTYISWSFGRT